MSGGGSHTGFASGQDDGDASETDSRRWMRDLGALLALPAFWVDHSPTEIVNGLLSVVFGMLQLDGIYVRFDEHQSSQMVEGWRPSGPRMPPELRDLSETNSTSVAGVKTIAVHSPDLGAVRVASLQITFPWEVGLILVSSARSDFPSVTETHLLRVAVGQAAIAVHTARLLQRGADALTVAEAKLARQADTLRGLVADIKPSLTAAVDRIHAAEAKISEAPSSLVAADSTASRIQLPAPIHLGENSPVSAPGLPLTRRETEVLGFVAQGLTNREIGALLWLSDRTVERHLTSLYRKIGVGRRSEATSFALRHALVPSSPSLGSPPQR